MARIPDDDPPSYAQAQSNNSFLSNPSSMGRRDLAATASRTVVKGEVPYVGSSTTMIGSSTRTVTCRELDQASIDREALWRAIDRPGAGSSSSWAKSTSSRTRDRLRDLERERDEMAAKAAEMKRLAEEERAIADRLKHEGGAASRTLTTSDVRQENG
jgi:hypothetical protein